MLRTAIASSFLLPLALTYPTDSLPKHNATSIDWAPCDLDLPSNLQELVDANGEPLFCAILEVPLDYTNPKDDRTTGLQLIKVNANKEPFKGSVLTNPGGPGGSGVEFMTDEGKAVRDGLGGQFDVIGFDPR
jgi:hypothetical protein